MFDAKETFNVTITPNVLKVMNELLTQYSNKIISVRSNRKLISLTNDIGPQTRVELYEKQNGNPEDNRLICIKKYENEDSAPSSPNKGLYFVPDYLDSYDDRDR